MKKRPPIVALHMVGRFRTAPYSDLGTGGTNLVARNRRSYLDRDLKLLFGWSAGRCAFPDCHQECIEPGTAFDDAKVVGVIAHIEAHSDTGPRANPSLAPKDRDGYENLILLCPSHHAIIDGQPNTYTSETIRGWKREHEQWVRTMYQRAMPGVTFAELKTVAMAILNTPQDPSESYQVTAPSAKMQKNGLTGRSRFMLTLGIGKSHDVAMFMESMVRLDYLFPERLKAGFVQRYNYYLHQGLQGDSLFSAMQDFSIGTGGDFCERAAALAVLAYMFEICEIFTP